ncbi:vitamin B12 ABC transporter ATP-binding protein BtuD [Serratia microhaemolytica]|uniref:vitamin B12 ABC transporter ATP-binding protein BtuD n=1 Tax=Serratia microhaemolytica TaxID=2675110 RepID=UPI0023EA6620|nr:vitamin B12 ABC transporter ATP-binding protein BtuD [Serratia microhaemolytica]
MNNAAVTGRLMPISAQLDAGQRVDLIGPNGAGKSTLLAHIAAVLPGVGEITFLHRSIQRYSAAELARYRAYLCQQQAVTLQMPVFQYLALHQPVGAEPQALEQTISYLTGRLALLDKLQYRLTQLSGGEWQRVRLAAVLLQVWPSVNRQSRLLLLDEPSNSLDIAQQIALNQLLAEFCQAGGAVLLSNHDLNDTLHHADQVWLLAEGRLLATGTSEQVMEPNRLGEVYGVHFEYSKRHQRWLIATAL